MTYTTCEICGSQRYCFLQFRPSAQQDEQIIIQRAVCPHCMTLVYYTNQSLKKIKIHSYYS